MNSLLVEEFIAAELTPDISQKITAKMFQEWLDGQVNYANQHLEE